MSDEMTQTTTDYHWERTRLTRELNAATRSLCQALDDARAALRAESDEIIDYTERLVASRSQALGDLIEARERLDSQHQAQAGEHGGAVT